MYEIREDDQPADVRADPLCAAGPTEDQPPMEVPSVPAEAQAQLIPPDLYPAIQRLMGRYKDLSSGKLGWIVVTPHRIALHPGTRPIRSQPFRTGFQHRRLLADQVAKQLRMGVIEPSQSE